MTRAAAALLLALAPGCGDDETPAPKPPVHPGATCSPGELAQEGGACRPAGLPAEAPPCAPGEVELEDGACEPAGVPEEACARGFEPDGERGCTPVLPPPCKTGEMAVPGDAACREVAPCGAGTWGDIPVEPGTQYVDASYAGADSDGSEAKPWTTIAPAVTAAPGGGMVAVAAGSYAEALVLYNKPVRVWGRCPAMVEIQGGGPIWPGALTLGPGAAGAELHTVALTGNGWGVSSSGTRGALVDRVWIHDVGEVGVDLDDTKHPAAITVTGSLIEGVPIGVLARANTTITIVDSVVRNAAVVGSYTNGIWLEPTSKVTLRGSVVESVEGIGIYAEGAVEVDASVIRAMEPGPGGILGRGISLQPNEENPVRPTLLLTRSVITGAREIAVSVGSGDATIDATVISSTQPLGDGTLGVGLAAGVATGEGPSTLELTRSLIADNLGAGATIHGSEATVEGLVVRDTTTSPSPGRTSTIGIEFIEGSKATMRASVVERSADIGVNVTASEVDLDSCVVRSNGTASGARGINVQNAKDGSARSNAHVSRSLVDGNVKYGIRASASDLVVESTVVSNTLGTVDSTTVGGIQIQNLSGGGHRGTATVRTSLVQGNVQAGVAAFGSDVTIESTLVEDTLPRDNPLGTGHGIFAYDHFGEPSNLKVLGSVVTHNPAFGIGAIGSSAEVSSTRIEDTLVRKDGRYGDGITVSSSGLPASLSAEDCLVIGSGRAGASDFGGHLAVTRVVLECNALDLDGEPVGETVPSFDDGGGNVCGCKGEVIACAVQSAALQPPEAPGVPDDE